MTFVVGLDVGQAADYTALVAVECAAARYEVRWIERFPLLTPYPTIVARVTGLLTGGPLRGAPLVVDGTGVGRAVVDLFRVLGPRVTPVTITAGEKTSFDRDSGYWRVPKRDLVASVQVALQNGALKFASALPEVQTLVAELLNFRVTLTNAGNDTYAAWREGQHDDLVLALALPLWWWVAGRSTRLPFAQGVATRSSARQ